MQRTFKMSEQLTLSTASRFSDSDVKQVTKAPMADDDVAVVVVVVVIAVVNALPNELCYDWNVFSNNYTANYSKISS